MPGTFTAVYNGTKAFVDSFSFALRAELKDAGVTVTCLMPGGVTAPLRAFQFAVKIPRAITHELKLQRAREPLVIFLAQTDGLAEKRGPLLLQPLGGMRNLQLIGRIDRLQFALLQGWLGDSYEA